MIQYSTRQELWRGIYQDWCNSGVNRSIYYQAMLPNLWPSNVPFPSRSTFFQGMRLFSEGELAQISRQTSHLVDHQLGNLRIVEVSREQLQQAQLDVPQQQPVVQNSNPKLWRMRLPNGTMIEFETDHPEALAMQMASLAWRSA